MTPSCHCQCQSSVHRARMSSAAVACYAVLLLVVTLRYGIALDDKLEVQTVNRFEVSQESRAIAKMTARCALYMDALKIFGCAHGYFSRNC